MASKTKASASKEVVTWDAELAKYAEVAAKMEESSSGGQFFSIKSGVLSWGGSPLPRNEMYVVILDSVFENVYYEGRFDADNPRGPTCFAFGRDDKELVPHILVTDAGQAQSDKCQGCEHNEFGSADTGRGKACKNSRRLAMIPAGVVAKNGEFDLFDGESSFIDSQIGYLKLPATSVKGYATFVKQVATTLRRPPFGIVTKVSVVPDAKTQFRVVFEAIESIPAKFATAIMARHEEATNSIEFPYQLDDPEAALPVKSKPSKGNQRTPPASKPVSPAKSSRRY